MFNAGVKSLWAFPLFSHCLCPQIIVYLGCLLPPGGAETMELLKDQLALFHKNLTILHQLIFQSSNISPRFTFSSHKIIMHPPQQKMEVQYGA
ncbi:MAG: hypothetical protein HYR94_04080 [Chloroflexi bacterium]|nr:hypothetical protein [Chloroflexota bacterium]